MDTSADEALWGLARAGNASAFAELFDRHQGRVFRHAARQLVDQRDAEDAAASAFFELWRRRTSVRVVNGSVLPWLLATTTNMSRNLARARRRYQAVLERLPRENAADAAELAIESIQQAESDRRIGAALDALHPTDAALVSLTALEGYPIAVAARALGLAPATARVRLHRARQRLRTSFSPAPATKGIVP